MSALRTATSASPKIRSFSILMSPIPDARFIGWGDPTRLPVSLTPVPFNVRPIGGVSAVEQSKGNPSAAPPLDSLGAANARELVKETYADRRTE